MGDSDAEQEAMAVIDAVGDSSGGVAVSENADKAQADMQEVLDMANMFDEDGGDDDFAYGFGDCTDAGDDSVARAVAEKVAEAKKLCMQEPAVWAMLLSRCERSTQSGEEAWRSSIESIPSDQKERRQRVRTLHHGL